VSIKLERQQIVDALNRYAGNQSRAARYLGVSRRTLVSRLDFFGIARPRKGQEPLPPGSARQNPVLRKTKQRGESPEDPDRPVALRILRFPARRRTSRITL
jgi:hypothetical protein